MPETGIEDLIRNPEDATTGCLFSMGYTLLVFILFIGVLVLISTYCGSGKTDPQPAANQERRAQE